MSNIIIPSSPVDRQAIKAVVEQISNSMARAESEAEYQKEALSELSKKYDIPAKHLKRMSRDFHKSTFEKTMDETEDYSGLYETIIVMNNDQAEEDED